MMLKIITYLVVLAVLVPAQQVRGQNGGEQDKSTMFQTSKFLAKGGIGIIRQDLYVVVKSSHNELILSAGERWTGNIATAPEVVFVLGNKVLLPQVLPQGFDLSEAVIVSFERNKVRFFDFSKMSGGYYARPEDNAH